jgi:hypothetical protein
MLSYLSVAVPPTHRRQPRLPLTDAEGREVAAYGVRLRVAAALDRPHAGQLGDPLDGRVQIRRRVDEMIECHGAPSRWPCSPIAPE